MGIQMAEKHRTRYEAGGAGCGASMPSPSTPTYSPTWKLTKPCTFGLLRGLPHVGMMGHCLHFQPFSLLRRMASRAENATLLIVACLSGEQPSSRSHPESTHQNRRYSYHQGNYKALRSCGPGLGTESNIYFYYVIHLPNFFFFEKDYKDKIGSPELPSAPFPKCSHVVLDPVAGPSG